MESIDRRRRVESEDSLAEDYQGQLTGCTDAEIKQTQLESLCSDFCQANTCPLISVARFFCELVLQKKKRETPIAIIYFEQFIMLSFQPSAFFLSQRRYFSYSSSAPDLQQFEKRRLF